MLTHTYRHTDCKSAEIAYRFVVTQQDLQTPQKFGRWEFFLRNIQIQTCFFCACLFWAPNAADLKLRDLDCLLTFTESLRRSYEKDEDFFVIFLLGVSAISSKVWLPSSKQHPKKVKTQYQAPTKLVWNSLQSTGNLAACKEWSPPKKSFSSSNRL